MKKNLVGYIFYHKDSKDFPLFELVSEGSVSYFPVNMKVGPGKYKVRLKHGKVVSCWKFRPTLLRKRDVQKAFRRLAEEMKDWNI